MQKTFNNQQGKEIVFQSLAEGATDIKFDNGGIYYTYDKDLITEANCYKRIRDKGNYQILCLPKDATEEQADMIVRKVNFGYWFDYTKPNARHDYMCCTPKDSLTSLLTSLGFKQDDNVLILEKI